MKSLAHPPTREARGLALYRERGAGIEHTAPHVYVVHLGRETCTCPDYERRGEPCKHLYAATVAASKLWRRNA